MMQRSTELGKMLFSCLLLLQVPSCLSLASIVVETPPLVRSTHTTTTQQLARQNYHVLDSLVDYQLLNECSQKAVDAFQAEGGHAGSYLDKPWKNSRIYIDGGQLWTPADASFMEPMIDQVRKALAPRLGLVSSDASCSKEVLEYCMPLESAFCNYYLGLGNGPRDMENHIDCNTQGYPVPLSVVVQGVYDDGNGNGNHGQILGRLDCQNRNKDLPQETVSLQAGDALALAGAWHKPWPVPDGAKRLVFVLFFKELNYVN